MRAYRCCHPWHPALRSSSAIASAVPVRLVRSAPAVHCRWQWNWQRSRDRLQAAERSCHTPGLQPRERITVTWRRFTRIGLLLPDHSTAKNSGSCQTRRPSIASWPFNPMLMGSCSRIQLWSSRTPGRLGSRGVVSIGFGSVFVRSCCSSANIRDLAMTS